MPNNTPGDKARVLLSAIEKRRQLAVLSEFEKIQVRLASELLDLFERIEKERQIDGNASPGLLMQKARTEALFEQVTKEIADASARISGITTVAQNEAVLVARRQASEYARLSADFAFFDGPATRELIGIAGNGRPLALHFATLSEPVREAMFDALFFGIATGRSNGAIAQEIRDAINGTTAQAMTIVRTETNRAYREATRKFYQENESADDADPGVIGWRWVAALDLNTCPICWALHGSVFKLKSKMSTHPNCRCTMVPVFAGDPRAVTGPELFAALNDSQRRAIIGPRRLELYLQGAELKDFIETVKTPFGIGRRVKPIIRTTFQVSPRLPKPATTARIPADRLPPARPTPDPALSAVAKFEPAKLREAMVKESAPKYAAFETERERLREEIKQIGLRTAKLIEATEPMRPKDGEDGTAFFEARRVIMSEKYAQQGEIIKQLDVIGAAEKRLIVEDRNRFTVPNPVELRAVAVSRLTREEKAVVDSTFAEYQLLVDRAAWKSSETLVKVKKTKARAYYTDRPISQIHINPVESQRRTIVHEISHGLEKMNSDILAAANEFLDYRTPGEVPIKLNKLLPRRGYRNDEKARPDKFANPYAGKVYGTVGKQDYTEVISMAVEALYADPYKFALEDPEYFDFILTVLRGRKWRISK